MYMGSQGPNASSCGQRSIWSDRANAQTELSLCWVHRSLLVHVDSDASDRTGQMPRQILSFRWVHRSFCWFFHAMAQSCALLTFSLSIMHHCCSLFAVYFVHIYRRGWWKCLQKSTFSVGHMHRSSRTHQCLTALSIALLILSRESVVVYLRSLCSVPICIFQYDINHTVLLMLYLF